MKQHWNLFYFGRQRWSNVLIKPLLHLRWMLNRRGCILLCSGRARNQESCLPNHTWGSKSMMAIIIIIIYTCPPFHDHCYQNPRLLPGSCDSRRRRMLPVHHFEDQTAYRLLQLMRIMFQCFIDFPMCVIISQCLLTFHNFTGLAAAPANNYDRVVF